MKHCLTQRKQLKLLRRINMKDLKTIIWWKLNEKQALQIRNYLYWLCDSEQIEKEFMYELGWDAILHGLNLEHYLQQNIIESIIKLDENGHVITKERIWNTIPSMDRDLVEGLDIKDEWQSILKENINWRPQT